MKINNFGPSGINPYKRQMNSMENAKSSAKAGADKVEISATAKEMHQLSQYSASRQERVEQLKLQVQNGTYKVNPEQVAKSMIDFYTEK
ncbi:flagellar biosynthesis anti-sigma factor FlgM [Bacillus benzoevorans]|uniref:Negative regulator of flagellin synthesis n=1 Tax=Bacillus benzoevorans TaxID=1456 RepID=A0A7X0HUW1_9BACI|nr:negative regulator of flagellin synthesis FlgM [Bacillus benzoevorans]